METPSNYGYPWWHYFVVAAAQAPYIAYLSVTGELHNGTPHYPFGLRDPVNSLRVVLTLIGRLVSVLMGAGVVIAAYLFSSVLWGHATGLAAAVLTMLSYLMCYYSGTGDLSDVPAFFWSACGLVVFATVLVDGLTPRRAAWLGVLAGVATATERSGRPRVFATRLRAPDPHLPPVAGIRLATASVDDRARDNPGLIFLGNRNGG